MHQLEGLLGANLRFLRLPVVFDFLSQVWLNFYFLNFQFLAQASQILRLI